MPKFRHSRHWKCLKKRATKWLQKAHEQLEPSPSFIAMYLEINRHSKSQVVYKGPSHMEVFATDEQVVKKFIEAAKSRPIGGLNPSDDLMETTANEIDCEDTWVKERITLPRRDPETYRSDTLQKLIPIIVNPDGKRNFWNQQDNKPPWWPTNVPFVSPNHVQKGQSKLSASQLREVLEEFFLNCKDSYTLTAGEDLPEEEDMHPGQDLVNSSSSLTKSSPKKIGKENPATSSPEAALHTLSNTQDWEFFKAMIMEMSSQFETGCITSLGVLSAREIPKHLRMDSQWASKIRAMLPVGYHAGNSTADGNCLFHSASIAISGSEDLSATLRLLSVISGVYHFNHYLEMYKSFISDEDTALQFLCTVGTDISFEQRPKDKPSVDELLQYTLKREIQNTARSGSYSGLLQVQLLADALGRPVRQHSEEKEFEHYQLTFYPCSCTGNRQEREAIDIMWVHMRESGHIVSNSMNHIIPVLPGSERCQRQENQERATIIDVPLLSVCLKEKVGQCFFKNGKKRDGDDETMWVRCDRCWGWYHCVCVGLSKGFCDNHTFVCCHLEGGDNPMVLMDPVTKERGSSYKVLGVRYSDVYTLYLGNGVSSVVIDFHTRTRLHNSDNICFLSAATYGEVLKVYKRLGPNSDALRAQYQKLNKSLNGGVKFWEKELVAFTCCISLHSLSTQTTDIIQLYKRVRCMLCDTARSNAWYWILIVVNIPNNIAFLLDSLNCSGALEYTLVIIEDFISKLLAKEGTSLNLKAVHVSVPQQTNGFDCGIHVMDSMEKISHDSSVLLREGGIDVNSTVPCDAIRMKLLNLCHIKSCDYYQKRDSGIRCGLEQRRSSRSSSLKKKQELKEQLHTAIRAGREDNLKVVHVPGKGKGIITTIPRKKGDFLCIYMGELITKSQALKREGKNSHKKSFMYFFSHHDNSYCMDATVDDGHLGRLVNHSKSKANVIVRVEEVDKKPYLCLLAACDIENGQELLYDYGDRRQHIIDQYTWLSS